MTTRPNGFGGSYLRTKQTWYSNMSVVFLWTHINIKLDGEWTPQSKQVSTRTHFICGVVAYPVRQHMATYFWSIIRRLVELCWAVVVFPASESVPPSFQPKKQTHSLQWVLMAEDFVISPTCEVGFDSRKDQLWKDPTLVLRVKSATWQPMVCRKPGLFVRLGK